MHYGVHDFAQSVLNCIKCVLNIVDGNVSVIQFFVMLLNTRHCRLLDYFTLVGFYAKAISIGYYPMEG